MWRHNDAETAKTVCGVAKQNLIHFPYLVRLTTGRNLAFLFIPPEILFGDAYEPNMYHLMEVDNPLALFPVELYTILVIFEGFIQREVFPCN